MHHFDAAAREGEGQGPEGAVAGPGEDLVECRSIDTEVSLEAVRRALYISLTLYTPSHRSASHLQKGHSQRQDELARHPSSPWVVDESPDSSPMLGSGIE